MAISANAVVRGPEDPGTDRAVWLVHITLGYLRISLLTQMVTLGVFAETQEISAANEKWLTHITADQLEQVWFFFFPEVF